MICVSLLFKYNVISSTFLSAPAEATEIDIFFCNDVSTTDLLFEQKYSEGSPFDFPKRIKITAVNNRASEVAKADEANETQGCNHGKMLATTYAMGGKICPPWLV